MTGAPSPPVTCPCDWNFKIGKKCYKFVKVPKTWDAARASCQASGGDLVIASSLIETNLLANEARSNGLNGAWLGYFRYVCGSCKPFPFIVTIMRGAVAYINVSIKFTSIPFYCKSLSIMPCQEIQKGAGELQRPY